MLILMSIVNGLALLLDVFLQPFNAQFRNVASALMAMCIALGSILAALAVAQTESAQYNEGVGKAVQTDAEIAAASGSQAVVTACMVGLYTALLLGLVISAVNMPSKLCLMLVGPAAVMLRRDVAEQMQKVVLSVDNVIIKSFCSSAERRDSSRRG